MMGTPSKTGTAGVLTHTRTIEKIFLSPTTLDECDDLFHLYGLRRALQAVRSGNKGPNEQHFVHLSWFSDPTKNHTIGSLEEVEILPSVKFPWIPFSGFRGEVEHVSAKQDPSGHLVFTIGPNYYINLIEDVEILLPVKFRWIPFSGFRGEVEVVPAHQRPGAYLVMYLRSTRKTQNW